MGWFDKLIDIIKLDLRGANLFSPKIIIINRPDKEDKFLISEDKNKVSINYPLLDYKEKELLKEGLKEGFEEKEVDLLEEKSGERVRDITQKIKCRRTQTILEFYKDKIPLLHWKALEASLYLRDVFEQGGAVGELKKDIIRKFGDDGRNIANLCSAGYFENYIKRIYEEMSFIPDFTIEKFQDHFKTIVTISPFAIFVSKEMNEEELSGEIWYRLETYKRYGIEFLAIHGIGKNNIQKIRRIIQGIEDKKNLNININQERNIIFVKIEF